MKRLLPVVLVLAAAVLLSAFSATPSASNLLRASVHSERMVQFCDLVPRLHLDVSL